MASKFTLINNPIPSDSNQYGGEYLIQLTSYYSGVDVSSDENIRINTPTKYYSGSLVMYDSNQSHTFTFITENVSSGNNKTITWRALTADNDYPVMENQAQTITNKVLGTGTTVSSSVDFNNSDVVDLGGIGVRDLPANAISFLDMTGVTPNTVFDILASYNTASYASISGATTIYVRLGYNSEIDSFQFYSSTTGSNTKFFEVDAKNNTVNFGTTAINFNSATLTGLVNIANANISASAAIAWTKLSKTGSVLADIANVNLSGLVDQQSIKWDSGTSKWIPFTPATTTANFLRLSNETGTEPTATTSLVPLYRKDLDVNNQQGFVSVIENGVTIKVRVF